MNLDAVISGTLNDIDALVGPRGMPRTVLVPFARVESMYRARFSAAGLGGEDSYYQGLRTLSSILSRRGMLFAHGARV